MVDVHHNTNTQARMLSMILPLRGETVDTNRRAEIRKLLQPQEVENRIEQLMAADQMRLSKVFTDQDIHQLCKELEIDFRERDYTPAVTLGLFVAQMLSRGDACSTVTARFNRERKREGLSPLSEDGSTYCKARARLPVKLINTLGQRLAHLQKEKTLLQWKWEGRDVYLVDGFTLRAADTLANQEVYPQPASQAKGLGYPQVRVLLTTSLATGCIVNFDTAPLAGKGNGERSLFRNNHGIFKSGDVIVGDSNFETFLDSALLLHQGVYMVCCINGSRNNPFEGVCQTLEESWVTVGKPKFDSARFTRQQWEALPSSITYRMIRYRVTGRKDCITIVTTLTDGSRYSAEAIAELYGLRWDVELDICCVKSTMGKCDLLSQTPENIDREIAASVLAYNLVRTLMSDAAAITMVHPREISFSRSRDAWISFGDSLGTANDLMWIILSATSRLVRDRPGRNEPRQIKRRNLTKYSKLRTPRPSKAKGIAATSDKPKQKTADTP
jgi:hypothetical protein